MRLKNDQGQSLPEQNVTKGIKIDLNVKDQSVSEQKLHSGLKSDLNAKDRSQLLHQELPANKGTVENIQHKATSCQIVGNEDGMVVCVLAVPLHITPQDFLKLMGPQRLQVSHFTILHDSVPNRYMILIKFRVKAVGDAFVTEFNGRPFSSFEAEMCNLVKVEKILVYERELIREMSLKNDLLSIPDIISKGCSNELNAFPKSRVTKDSNIDLAAEKFVQDQHHPIDSIVKSSNLPLALELPTCPVCLDRMDASVTGLLTTICRHTFHCNCISKWADSTCPVCRYSSQDTLPQTYCSNCPSSHNLWICLICAHVGCGRYVRKHAYDHYKETNHIYSLELETQRVWDYVGDGYVHRLIQSKSEGLVQLPAPSTSTRPNALDTLSPTSLITPNDMLVAEKVESLGLEYASMLQNQLSAQRNWYESKLKQNETKATDYISSLVSEIELVKIHNEALVTEAAALQSLAAVQSQRIEGMAVKYDRVLKRIKVVERELVDEKALNSHLGSNQLYLQQQILSKDENMRNLELSVGELKDQVRDLMFFLETKSRVENGELDVKDASIIGVAPAPESPSKPKGGKSRKKK